MKKSAPDILSVSGLNRAAKDLLEGEFGTVHVEGEISNLARPASGHLYFSLKDRQAQVRCAFFRQRQRGLKTPIESGDQVLVQAKLSLYEPRGDYQLIVEQVEPAGRGALQRQFEILKAKLAAEGLFNESGKQPIPTHPKRIGLITSSSGAALRDILNVLKRRSPAVEVVIYASAVQGAEAPASLRRALHKATYRDEADVLVITRGGGSIEDLAAFNDEGLARDIASCKIPIISGVGHEIDFTIADFAADLRAPTPSAAAELATTDQRVLLQALAGYRHQMQRLLLDRLQQRQQATDQLSRRLHLQNPLVKIRLNRQRLATCRRALVRSAQSRLERIREQQRAVAHRLSIQSPERRVQHLKESMDTLMHRLIRTPARFVEPRRKTLAAAARALHAVSPLATLDRGYAIVSSTEGKALTRASQVNSGDAVHIRLAEGSLRATVTEKDDAT